MTLYVIQAADGTDAALVKARVIKEGFSGSAFIFAQVWLIYHRLWGPLLIWIALEIIYFVVVAPRVSGAASVGVDLLAHLFIGFEGNRLRQNKGARRSAVIDLVEARNRNEAEAIFFRRHASGAMA